MNLDDRARDARASLEAHVRTDLDLRQARAGVDHRNRGRHSDRRRARIAVAALGVIALLGGIAVVSGSNQGPDDPTREPRELAVDEDGGGETRSDDEMIEAMPLGPTDGKDSWRLPVAVSPQTGLQEGDVVTIYGRGFLPGDSLGVVHCSSEADTQNAGVTGCDLSAGVSHLNADANGDIVAEVTVQRFIQTPGYGRIDCASAAERCLLGMGAMNDYDRSGGVYIDFAGAPPFPQPTFTATGVEAGFVPGQEVPVEVTGWVPGRQIRIQQCALGAGPDATDLCEPLLDTRADPAGALSAAVVVNAEVVSADGQAPCGEHCYLQATGIGIPEGTTAPFPAEVPIWFVEGAGDVTTTTHAGTTTTPAPIEGNPADAGSGSATTTSSVSADGSSGSTQTTADAGTAQPGTRPDAEAEAERGPDEGSAG